MRDLKFVECPRDAMQGLHDFIPTHAKISYLNEVLKCGFHTVDAGSFVSPKAIPQMRDTGEVIEKIDDSASKLLVIVPNERGANDACSFDRIDYLGFPFSVSEEFQKRNTNATIDESFRRVEKIQTIAQKRKKELVLYLSMGFGNPYGEAWHPDIVTDWSEKLFRNLDVRILAISDTIGAGNPEIVKFLFETLIPSMPEVEFGAHLHTIPSNAAPLIDAAYQAGCRRFDGAIKGFGGCPMAKDDLTGNMPTERMLQWFDEQGVDTGISRDQFEKTMVKALEVFP